MTTRQKVRAINEAIRHTADAAYLRPAGLRIHTAAGDHGTLCVRCLSSGRWITTTPADSIEITHGARCVAIYPGGPA